MSIQVLIVDDDQVVVFLHKTIVSRSSLSANPTTFISGRKTLEYLDTHHRSGDKFLVLLDINMPMMNGWELLEEISKKSYANDILVAMVTSSINKLDKDRVKEYPQVIEYIEKPITLEICEALAKHPSLSELLGIIS